MKQKERLTGYEYMKSVLQWKSFIKAHTKLGIALEEILTELEYLRDKVNELEHRSM